MENIKQIVERMDGQTGMGTRTAKHRGVPIHFNGKKNHVDCLPMTSEKVKTCQKF